SVCTSNTFDLALRLPRGSRTATPRHRRDERQRRLRREPGGHCVAGEGEDDSVAFAAHACERVSARVTRSVMRVTHFGAGLRRLDSGSGFSIPRAWLRDAEADRASRTAMPPRRPGCLRPIVDRVDRWLLVLMVHEAAGDFAELVFLELNRAFLRGLDQLVRAALLRRRRLLDACHVGSFVSRVVRPHRPARRTSRAYRLSDACSSTL